jgi:hypothetical protein
MEFKPFIDDLLSQGFESFVTLYFPGPRPSWEYASEWQCLKEAIRDLTDETRRAARQKRISHAQGCYEHWLGEVKEQAVTEDTRHITVIEVRTGKRDFLFHVLLGGCDLDEYNLAGHWGPRWKEISGGKAFMRKMDERIGGLLRYFVFKANRVLDVDCGRVRGRFTAEDFEEWKGY